ncbi:hypothetical protein [Nostoc sp.]|uniref:hypothetical protein n=1 Tax=Nostoc sp. TaxID=1180 RepID=UPI002FF24982
MTSSNAIALEANLYVTYNSGAHRSVFANPTDKPTDFAPSFVNLDLSGRIPLTSNLGLEFLGVSFSLCFLCDSVV